MDNPVDYVKKLIRLERTQQEKQIKKQKELISNGMRPAAFCMPLTLQFELTGRCNCYCRHCYNRSGDLPPDAMTAARWKELSKELVGHGGIFECIISGGEPLLLGDDLFDIMDILHDDGTVFLFITNGLLLTNDAVERLRKYRYRWIQVSVDASRPEWHDELRKVSGSWKKAVGGALRVSDAGLPLAIASTVCPATVEELPAMAQLAYGCGASMLITGEVFPSGRGIENDALLLTDAQRGRLWSLIEEQQNVFLNRMFVQRSMSNRVQLEGLLESPMTGAVIRPNGDIRLDCIAPFVIGNVAASAFLNQWQKGRNAWKNEQVLSFVQSVDPISGKSSLLKNHVEGDVQL